MSGLFHALAANTQVKSPSPPPHAESLLLYNVTYDIKKLFRKKIVGYSDINLADLVSRHRCPEIN